MAGRRIVHCYKCGKSIDKKYARFAYNKKTRRYTCHHCVSGTSPESVFAPPSEKTYKFSGVVQKVCGIILIVLSLLLTLALPPVGIIGIALGVFFLFSGKKHTKKAKEMSKREE